MARPAPLVVPRDDLYEAVWSKSLVKLAADLGVSATTIVKACKTKRLHPGSTAAQ